MSISQAEFDTLQDQLLALKSEKYELKERERKLQEGTRHGSPGWMGWQLASLACCSPRSVVMCCAVVCGVSRGCAVR